MREIHRIVLKSTKSKKIEKLQNIAEIEKMSNLREITASSTNNSCNCHKINEILDPIGAQDSQIPGNCSSYLGSLMGLPAPRTRTRSLQDQHVRARALSY